MINTENSGRVTASRVRRHYQVLPIACALMALSELAVGSTLAITPNDPAFRSRLYAGAGLGQSSLDPDTRGTVFDVSGGDAGGTQLRLGIDLHNQLALELETSVLGSAGLEQVDADVKYTAASFSALLYGLNGVQARSRREEFSAFLRIGYGILKRASAVQPFDASESLPVIGIGAEYGFSNGVGVRAEITRYDGDAVFYGIGAVYRFSASPRSIGGMIAQAVEPALRSSETRVSADGRRQQPDSDFHGDAVANVSAADNAGRIVANRAPDEITSRGAVTLAARVTVANPSAGTDVDQDGIRNSDDQCEDTVANTTVATNGCGVLDAVLSEVTFKPGSSFLTARARGDLDRVARQLLSFPEVPVEVQAHTDNQGQAAANLVLSLHRAEAVVEYLVTREVNELQLQPQGMGEAYPLTSNATPEGRRRNRRVELVTLPNLSVAAMHGGAVEAQRRSGPNPRRSSATTLAIAAQAAAGSRAAADAYPLPPIAGIRIEPLPGPVRVDGLNIDGVVSGLGFASGASELSPASRQALVPLIEKLGDFPAVRISVMAHTDSSGSRAANQRLSERRAGAVVEHLVEQGIEPNRLQPMGFGEMLPRVQNVSARDRAHNRRVEIRVVK